MIDTVYLSKTQKSIIREIATIQMDSLDRGRAEEISIMNNVAAEGVEVSLKDIHDLISSDIQIYENLTKYPNRFVKLDHANLSKIRHILLNFYDDDEIEYESDQYKQEVSNLWKKLFLLDFIRNHQQ